MAHRVKEREREKDRKEIGDMDRPPDAEIHLLFRRTYTVQFTDSIRRRQRARCRRHASTSPSASQAADDEFEAHTQTDVDVETATRTVRERRTTVDLSPYDESVVTTRFRLNVSSRRSSATSVTRCNGRRVSAAEASDSAATAVAEPARHPVSAIPLYGRTWPGAGSLDLHSPNMIRSSPGVTVDRPVRANAHAWRSRVARRPRAHVAFSARPRANPRCLATVTSSSVR